ncbi:uncharacterized protein LOC114313323 [Camellia sinensis]|uniref:uncharacterized protein LOC114313323 n=1 Tax=Camellia sinensis TaxID=4442 RepID=UPI0010363F8A|nr:uncharacterized protein LOC114313323 [Camellia sinensis]
MSYGWVWKKQRLVFMEITHYHLTSCGGSILVDLYYSWMEHSSKESTKVSYLRQQRKTETMRPRLIDRGSCMNLGRLLMGMRYGEMTSNAAESFNNWIKEQVSKANEDVFEVHSIPSVTVDVVRRTCFCFKWKINGFPCDYAVIAIQKSHYNLYDCAEHYFHVETYRAAYSGAIFTIPSVEKLPFDPTDYTIYPPTVKRPLGRPKKNRIPSRGEKLKQIRCGRCDKLGSHNRKSCKEPI